MALTSILDTLAVTADGLPAPQPNSVIPLARRHSIATTSQYKPMTVPTNPQHLMLRSPKKPTAQNNSPAGGSRLVDLSYNQKTENTAAAAVAVSCADSPDLRKQQPHSLAEECTIDLTNATTINPNFHYSVASAAGDPSQASSLKSQHAAPVVDLTAASKLKTKPKREERNSAPPTVPEKPNSQRNLSPPHSTSSSANEEQSGWFGHRQILKIQCTVLSSYG